MSRRNLKPVYYGTKKNTKAAAAKTAVGAAQQLVAFASRGSSAAAATKQQLVAIGLDDSVKADDELNLVLEIEPEALPIEPLLEDTQPPQTTSTVET
jgi:hypothetical protein